MRWFWREVLRFGSSGDGDGLGRDGKRLAKEGENGAKAEESRVEKAKRKAEEKRLARLEKEMLEEEERKQREEMAKLVEERRRLRDEKAEAEERSKGATPVGEKDPRKEVERRRQERRRKDEKDKGSSKSNSDCEDIERRVTREGERKRDSDRRNEPEKRDATRVGAEGHKPYNFDANNQGSKTVQSKAKYFGRMTGGLLSSSRGFGGGSFFGRSAQTSAPQVNKVTKPLVTVTDQSNVVKRDAQPPATAKSATAGGTTNSWTNVHRSVSNKSIINCCSSLSVTITTYAINCFHPDYRLTNTICIFVMLLCRLVQMCSHSLLALKSHGTSCLVAQHLCHLVLMFLLQPVK